MDMEGDQPLLQLETMIGFGGSVVSGLQLHPEGKHLIYPVGCTVVVENIASKKQEFLSGHTNTVSCVAVSRSGRFIASGQVTYMGFKADIFVWDFHQRDIYCKLTLHRNNIEALAFSPTDKYLVSLGGQDDGSVVVWNIAKKEAVCGSPAQAPSSGLTHTLVFANTSDDVFITGGKDTLRIWYLTLAERKIRPVDVKTGQIKRVVRFIQVSPDDKYFYCGTTTGDIMAINMVTNTFQVVGPEKERFSLGITALVLLPSGEFLVGAGDGTIAIIGGAEARFKRTKKQQILAGSVTSVAVKGQQAWIGTSQCNIYCVTLPDLSVKLVTTCHYDSITDVTYPHGCSDLVATCSAQDVRLWNAKKAQELLRITVPNMKCNAVVIMRDGKSIVSGWDDGRIRAYYPESGRPFYTMDNAYGGAVTALAAFADCRHVISGSNLGHVVVWDVPSPGAVSSQNAPLHVTRHFLLKEHKAAVTCIRTRRNDAECITSSTDGSCIIWDLIAKCRRQMIRVNTLFKYVCYHPMEHQVLTTGTDRKVGYWETFDGSMIRELEGSLSGSVNALDISSDGTYFVSGGDDKLIKVWMYDEGNMTHIGVGHSAPITGVKISPDERHIISVSSDGAILRWTFPHRPTFVEH
jgi:WD40 repeat protein